MAAGAPVVVLDQSLTPLFQGADDVGAGATFRVSPAGRDHADPSAITFAAVAGGEALRPLAPVHLRAARGPGGVTFAWIRRTRRGGDNWEALDVPLSEEAEAYRLDILSGAGALRRSLAANGPACLYAAADEIADFGAAQATLSLKLVQISRAVGDGAAFSGVVTID